MVGPSQAPGHAELVRQLLGGQVAVSFVFQLTDGDHHVDRGIAQDAPHQLRIVQCGNHFGVISMQTHDTVAFTFGGALDYKAGELLPVEIPEHVPNGNQHREGVSQPLPEPAARG
ncbi:hypothetical protein A9W95_15005 [Mycobacterium sp. 1423905.2]|nr:hypothetical protein A9W95_15005 [Mycobacterium sp. 1423905.2]